MKGGTRMYVFSTCHENCINKFLATSTLTYLVREGLDPTMKIFEITKYCNGTSNGNGYVPETSLGCY